MINMKLAPLGLFSNNPTLGYIAITITITLCLYIVGSQPVPTQCEPHTPKYLFIYSPYCVHCQNMMSQVAQYPQFEWVSIIEPENQWITTKFPLTRIPAFIICGKLYIGEQNISQIMEVCDEQNP